MSSSTSAARARWRRPTSSSSTRRQAQKIIARNFYRPSKPEAADPADIARFPKIRLVTIDQAFGGWAKAQSTHFADGGAVRPDLQARPRARQTGDAMSVATLRGWTPSIARSFAGRAPCPASVSRSALPSSYLSLIVLIPLAVLVWRASGLGLDGIWRVATTPRVLAALQTSFVISAAVGAGERAVRRDRGLGAGALRLSRQARARCHGRPAVCPADRRGGHRARGPLRHQRLDRRAVRAVRHQDRLHAARHLHRPGLHRPALRRAHRPAGAAGSRPRGRGGCRRPWAPAVARPSSASSCRR